VPGPRAAEGSRWLRFRQLVFTTYGGLCHICLHGGARQVDHLIPKTEGGDPWDLRNCRPAHGSGPGRRANPCPVCSRQAGRPIYCNQIRAYGSVERARRIIAERLAAAGVRNPAPGQAVRETGREW